MMKLNKKNALFLASMATIGWLLSSSWFYVCRVQYVCDSTPATSQTTPQTSNILSIDDSPMDEKAQFGSDVTLNFLPDSSELALTNKYDTQIKYIKLFLDKNPNALVDVTGYTTSLPSPLFDETVVGMERANAVKQILVDGGINAGRIKTFSKGSSVQIADSNTDEGAAANRRAVINIANN